MKSSISDEKLAAEIQALRASRLGRLDEALHAYRGALALDYKTNEARIHNNIGNVLAYQRKWREALLSYHEAEEADPDFPETHYNLAHVLLSYKRLEEAERERLKNVRIENAKENAIRATRAAEEAAEDQRLMNEYKAKLDKEESDRASGAPRAPRSKFDSEVLKRHRLSVPR